RAGRALRGRAGDGFPQGPGEGQGDPARAVAAPELAGADRRALLRAVRGTVLTGVDLAPILTDDSDRPACRPCLPAKCAAGMPSGRPPAAPARLPPRGPTREEGGDDRRADPRPDSRAVGNA